MLKAALITIAGTSSRFRRTLGHDCLKCIFYEDDPKECLLYRQISSLTDMDKYILVGGYRFDELKSMIENEDIFTPYRDRIELVYNEKYEDFGSGYSLYLGLVECMRYNPDEILFLEGDLFVLHDELQSVVVAKGDVITANNEPIYADRSVIFYVNESGLIRYVYDTGHMSLSIGEPFKALFNSGQIWKFTHIEKVRDVLKDMKLDDWKGTNLTFISKYFCQPFNCGNIRCFSVWKNCNTYEDFLSIKRRVNC